MIIHGIHTFLCVCKNRWVMVIHQSRLNACGLDATINAHDLYEKLLSISAGHVTMNDKRNSFHI